MTNQQLKELEDKLWDAANALRAYGGLKASDYAVPVLGVKSFLKVLLRIDTVNLSLILRRSLKKTREPE